MTADQVNAQMPDFSHSFAGFRHTVDSALEILANLAVPASRVTLRMAGAGAPPGWIVSQSPAPGALLTPDETVLLSVSGVGFCQNLPVGMWDKGDESQPGTAELLEFIDDPLRKADHWIREGALLFNISPDNSAACSRWISLFGLHPEKWAAEKWYRLSVLLPNIQALAGTETGIRFALDLVLELPLQEIVFRPAIRRLRKGDLSRLGETHSRAGFDYILGDHLEDLSEFVLVIGPITLDAYDHFQRPNLVNQLHDLLGLVVPCFRAYSIRWSVLDATQAPRLGRRARNSVLGINSHLGRSAGSLEGATAAAV